MAGQTRWLETALGVGVVNFALACSPPARISSREAADANDTGRTLAATNEGERTLLARLPSLPAGKPQRIGDDTVVADAPYAAASGRTCRALRIQKGRSADERGRLACHDGKAWFFVPDVFGGTASGE